MSEFIEIIGAETHNLKNISLKIPKNKLVVVTGLSGSGKSSLAFETLYAEGQKRYLESLSTFARMMISNTSDATKVQEIRGLSPTIAINQKTVGNNPRSTVGTITEIYDFYRLLYTNIGIPHCPNHPEQALTKNTIQEIFDNVKKLSDGTKIFITFPLSSFLHSVENVDSRQNDVEVVEDVNSKNLKEISQIVSDKGFVRYMIGESVHSVADNFEGNVSYNVDDVSIIVDRLVVRSDDNVFDVRLRDSLLLAKEKSNGLISIYLPDEKKVQKFSLGNFCPIC